MLSIGSPSVAEGDSGTADLAFVVTLTGSTSQEVTVAYADRGTGTATSGTDYTAVTAGTLTFAAGDTSKTVTVAVTGDTVDEPNETVVLRLSSATNASLSGGAATLDGTGTITDDDETAVTLSLHPATVNEGAGPVRVTAVVEVVGGPRAEETAAEIAVAGGSAEAGADYLDVSPFSATILAGQSRAEGQFLFEPVDDEDREENETVLLRVAVEGQGGTSLTATATLTITDNDGIVTLSVSPLRISEGAPPTVVTVTAAADRPVESDLGITVSFEAQGTEPAVEYSLAPEFLPITIPAGQDRGTATLVLSPVDDRVDTRNTRIRVSGTADSSAWAVRPATLLLTDNDDSAGELGRGPPQVTLWTDRPDYGTGDQVRLYLDIDPHGDEREYTVFFCLDSIETGERKYLALWGGSRRLRQEAVDQSGQLRSNWRAARLERVEERLVWTGQVPRPGLWHFVAELRSPGTTQVLKRAYAKFVVTEKKSMLLNRVGAQRTLTTDLRLTKDRVYYLGDRLQVARGATLSIEAGTLIKAFGPAAAIVVEPGGRIEVRGRREAPVVMTCSAPVGERFPGCWGGLVVRGRAGSRESSGELRYLRVEFAGGGASAAPPAALVLDGAGSGTVIDHVQAHASLGDGLAFRGGTAHCSHCVSSDALGDSVAWSHGWQGSAQYLYVQQGAQGTAALRGSGGDWEVPSAGPEFRNVTLVGGYNVGVRGGAPGTNRSIGPGIVLDGQAAVTAWNLLASGFGGFAVDAPATSFAAGHSRIAGALLNASGCDRTPFSLVSGELEPWVKYTRADPDLIDVRHAANPDPRPRSGSPVLMLGVAMVAPFDMRFAPAEDCVGAFARRNWLEEWTFFGAERDYALPGQGAAAQSAAGAFPVADVVPAAGEARGDIQP